MMLFHVCDPTFKRINSAIKRIKHFAEDNGFIDNNHHLEVIFQNMKIAWPESDSLEQLVLLDWFCKHINNFCENNIVSSDNVAKRIMYEFLSGPYIWADFNILTKLEMNHHDRIYFRCEQMALW